MKFAITGHTNGIGKALFEKVDNAIGFSLTTGYDITHNHDISKIVEEIHDCDVFVNNAFADYGQCKMLFEVWKSWKDTDKTIINVGSDVTKYKMSTERLEILDYFNYKTALKNLHDTLDDLNTNVKMHYISFGYVATAGTLSKPIPNRMIKPLEEAVDTIINLC
jgi:hypothetical protein